MQSPIYMQTHTPTILKHMIYYQSTNRPVAIMMLCLFFILILVGDVTCVAIMMLCLFFSLILVGDVTCLQSGYTEMLFGKIWGLRHI